MEDMADVASDCGMTADIVTYVIYAYIRNCIDKYRMGVPVHIPNVGTMLAVRYRGKVFPRVAWHPPMYAASDGANATDKGISYIRGVRLSLSSYYLKTDVDQQIMYEARKIASDFGILKELEDVLANEKSRREKRKSKSRIHR